MSALTPWDPFRELDELQNRLATMFGRIPQRQGARTGNEAMTTADWAPMADISEDENAFLLKLDLPEVPKDAVRVSAENGVLTISGERKLEKEEQGKKFHRFGIRSIPTLILFRGGHEVARQAGATGAQDIMRWVASQLPR
ncbi:heat shock protein Hsp20 [Alkalidesulfovibrio alkalitolerans DSM 16529]|uniref:Heat shock protein Hsp20 n=1 Tax=Alkalidesulfovibrio alkalitolerans DSM 16529 TaxID=1121439 RepID=S7UNX4_9BACT|nr:heat shock protein Hsp20 [Alkalidesulfovibrio alkalitolerans DSM 16529]